MSVVVVTPGQGLVSYDLAKKHLKLETDDEVELVAAYIEAASAWIDGPTGWLGRTIMPQTLELRCSTFSGAAVLPYGPATEIVSVKYVSPAGVETTLDPTVYQLIGGGLALAKDASWPNVRGDAEGVRVQFKSGDGVVPASVKHAVLLLVGQWHKTREAVNIGNIVNEMPFGVEALLQPLRSYRI